MTAPSVADLLGRWLAPVGDCIATPAKAANAASRKDSCGLPVDSTACESLRVPASRDGERTDDDSDSHTFAALRNRPDALQIEQWRGVPQDSQDSQDSQSLLPSTQLRSCADCVHHLPRGTCARPEDAGLIPTGEGFGIAWPEPMRAVDCTAFEGTATSSQARPFRLAAADADVAHAEPWDDPAILRYRARAHRFRRLGFGEQDADDLAERLHLRDVCADERRSCSECRALTVSSRSGWRCGNHLRAGLLTPELGRDLVSMLQRCPGFEANLGP
jgi:hypothetical protein